MTHISKCLLTGAGIFFYFILPGCSPHSGGGPGSDHGTRAASGQPDTTELFTLLTAEQTHIDFNNQLTEGLNTNVLLYEYFYNGGGVAIADLNGDGLQDIYFTGNMTAIRCT
jgi:hypothetical protein